MVDHEVEYLWMLMSFLVHIFYVLRKLLPKLLTDFRVLPEPASSGFLYVKQDLNNEVDHINLDSNIGRTEMDNVVDDEVVNVARPSIKAKKRPARIMVPEILVCSDFGKATEEDVGEKEVEVEGCGYCLFSRKGKRHVMEDGYGAITDINGDSKQAFFGVFDGHGGRAAVDFVSERLGKNIVNALARLGGGEDSVEIATKYGYLTTDKEFLNTDVSSGACAATVLLKDGQLHVANAGDCRVVIGRNGVATALTTDHRPGREDERIRIENLGGYVNCRNGVWRVQDSLAVSRAFGDSNLKEWIISEPETMKLSLTAECQYLIIASDGLWDKVTDQEAVDVVSRQDNFIKACKDLVDISCSRGSRDDISVLVVDLQRFVPSSGL